MFKGSTGEENNPPTSAIPTPTIDVNDQKSEKLEEKTLERPEEDDEKSVDSFNTAASSLSLNGNVCKICHCGEEVFYSTSGWF